MAGQPEPETATERIVEYLWLVQEAREVRHAAQVARAALQRTM
ncbi:MAG: hypothetical protein ACRDXC_04610 [Acidimicrobiales bacterium]